MALIFVTGYVRAGAERLGQEANKERAAYVEIFKSEQIELIGVIRSSRQTTSGNQAWIVDVRESILGKESWSGRFSVRVYANPAVEQLTGRSTEKSVKRLPVERDYVKMTVRLRSLNPPSNPGEFDYKSWLSRQGVYLHGTVVQIQEVTHADGIKKIPARLRYWVRERIDERFGEQAPLARALLTGDREQLEREHQDSFARAGLAHIMAVSGLHVGLLIAPLWILYRRISYWIWIKWPVMILVAILLWVYAAITDFTPSVNRASLMTWFLFYAFASYEPGRSLNLVGVSSLIVLLADPGQLFDIGFQLSYSAVTAILVFMPQVQRLTSVTRRGGLIGRATSILFISVIVQVALFPMLNWHFGEISLVSPFVNLLVLPPLSVIVPAGLLLTVIPDTFLEGLRMVLVVVKGAFTLLETLAMNVGIREWAWLNLSGLTYRAYLFWLWSVVYLLHLKNETQRYRLTIILTVLLLCTSLINVAVTSRPAVLQVTVLDVGQGDAIHVTTPNGRQILIDSGPWSPYGSSAERVLLPYFRSEGVSRLDALILSHPHADHIGGVPDLLKKMDVQTIYYSGNRAETQIYRRYRKSAVNRQIPIESVQKGDLLKIDPSIRVLVMGPGSTLSINDPNNYSVVLKVVYNKSSLMLTGDAEQAQETRITGQYGRLLESDFLKVGHHGSRTSSTDRFLSIVDPVISVVSAGYDNRFGHPHGKAVKRLKRHSENLYYTSLNGAVRYHTDGRRWWKIR